MNREYNLQSFQTDDILFEAVANFIIELASKTIQTKGRFILVLSGGNTPNQLYTLLAGDKFNKKMPWKNTFVFWGDERCVGLDDKLNNAHVAISLLLDKVEIPKSNIFPTPVNLSPRIKEFPSTKTPSPILSATTGPEISTPDPGTIPNV